ncbi:hypothetical protein GA0070622_1178 [Micromonospora sediminicola]|uniref:Uncharacterized protein n=1 Tax=Micromonospora sediminicola TaxID=946078 RepID=A0A1A9B530_9ACTN|nr:hypothetical protein [Micromonospora sediminicola]SBT64208.1 hypothetical protein GA0070622_1178 [Micromonospora sediminicola]
MPDIPAALLSSGGPVGVLLFVVALVLTGRLVPRTVHEDRVRDKDDQIAHLRATLAVRDEQVRVRDEQVQKLLPNTDLTVQLLQGLAREAGRHDLET